MVLLYLALTCPPAGQLLGRGWTACCMQGKHWGLTCLVPGTWQAATTRSNQAEAATPDLTDLLGGSRPTVAAFGDAGPQGMEQAHSSLHPQWNRTWAGAQVHMAHYAVRVEGYADLALAGSLLLTSPSKPYIAFMFFDSWLPRARCTRSGYSTLNARRVRMTSTEKDPLSTKSPAAPHLVSPRASLGSKIAGW